MCGASAGIGFKHGEDKNEGPVVGSSFCVFMPADEGGAPMVKRFGKETGMKLPLQEKQDLPSKEPDPLEQEPRNCSLPRSHTNGFNSSRYVRSRKLPPLDASNSASSCSLPSCKTLGVASSCSSRASDMAVGSAKSFLP